MLLRRQATQERDEHIDMTPMVDVVFQLMTFMLFSMQIGGGEKVDIPQARHGVGVEETQATFLTILKPTAPGAKSRIIIGNGPGTAVDIDRACQAVSQGVAAGRRKVVLQADGDVPHGEMIAIIGEIAKKESGATIHIGVQELKKGD